MDSSKAIGPCCGNVHRRTYLAVNSVPDLVKVADRRLYRATHSSAHQASMTRPPHISEAGREVTDNCCQTRQILPYEGQEQRQGLHSVPSPHDGPLSLTMRNEGASQVSETTRDDATPLRTLKNTLEGKGPDEYVCTSPHAITSPGEDYQQCNLPSSREPSAQWQQAHLISSSGHAHQRDAEAESALCSKRATTPRLQSRLEAAFGQQEGTSCLLEAEKSNKERTAEAEILIDSLVRMSRPRMGVDGCFYLFDLVQIMEDGIPICLLLVYPAWICNDSRR